MTSARAGGSGRRALLIAAGCLALGIALYELLPSDEARIKSSMNELCVELDQTRDEASLARLRQSLSRALTPHVTVHVAELGQDIDGVDAVLTRAHDLLGEVPLSFALSNAMVHLSGRLARVDADLIVTVSGSGEQRRDLRPTRIRLLKVGDVWQIEAIDVDPVAPSEPEARP